MRLMLNYKCKQCGMVMSTQAAERVKDVIVGVHGISFKRASLKIDNHTLSVVRFITHPCNGAIGLCELVGWRVED